jgi:hypothetical protein
MVRVSASSVATLVAFVFLLLFITRTTRIMITIAEAIISHILFFDDLAISGGFLVDLFQSLKLILIPE